MITIAKLPSARPHSVSTAGRTLSKTAKTIAWRDRARDGKTLKHFRNLAHERRLREIRLTSVRDRPSTLSHSSSPTPRILTPHEEALLIKIRKQRLKYRKHFLRQFPTFFTPPCWEKATPVLRSNWWQQAVREAAGVPFVVNFNPDVLARAEASAKGAFAVLRNRVRDALKEEFGGALDFWCSLDRSQDGRLHIQGGIIVSAQHHDRLRKALRSAGGKWGHSRSADRQVWIGEEGDYAGQWGSYSVRHAHALRDELGKTATFATKAIRDRAEAMYARDREELIRFHRET